MAEKVWRCDICNAVYDGEDAERLAKSCNHVTKEEMEIVGCKYLKARRLPKVIFIKVDGVEYEYVLGKLDRPDHYDRRGFNGVNRNG